MGVCASCLLPAKSACQKHAKGQTPPSWATGTETNFTPVLSQQQTDAIGSRHVSEGIDDPRRHNDDGNARHAETCLGLTGESSSMMTGDPSVLGAPANKLSGHSSTGLAGSGVADNLVTGASPPQNRALKSVLDLSTSVEVHGSSSGLGVSAPPPQPAAAVSRHPAGVAAPVPSSLRQDLLMQVCRGTLCFHVCICVKAIKALGECRGILLIKQDTFMHLRMLVLIMLIIINSHRRHLSHLLRSLSPCHPAAEHLRLTFCLHGSHIH